MPPRHGAPRRRLLLPLVLATVLAGEVAGLALATRGLPAARASEPVAAVAAESPAADGVTSASRGTASAGAEPDPGRRGGSAAVLAERRSKSDQPRPAGNRGATARPDVASEPRSVATGAGTRRGSNHVWIPALGIDRSVDSFPCDRTRPPDNFVYRWGCAGRNNVYLLGHAHSVFKPLHDVYVRGALRKGMTVDYADRAGYVRTYAVTWWKVTRPTSAASWAWAPQSRPSMTLQTCVGANSEYRLIVRLVATD